MYPAACADHQPRPLLSGGASGLPRPHAILDLQHSPVVQTYIHILYSPAWWEPPFSSSCSGRPNHRVPQPRWSSVSSSRLAPLVRVPVAVGPVSLLWLWMGALLLC
jgi:hypothetical protein